MTTQEIRQAFLDFFRSKGHELVPSAPIVVKNDPTLMFTNAGMNQFKDLFLGESAVKFKRIADTQRCLRVSGKHNDLEEVGIDTYHHTMFEMLGNWSFGDYFKEEAIAWSWELLTQVYQIPTDMIYVTVFAGDESEGLPKDQEAFDIWKKYIAEDRILLGNKKDNFWEMGETGPCGPCSEIHVDMRSADLKATVPGSSLVNQDDPQVIEIWNNVFMQFNRLKTGELEKLPNQHVDTGMGLERLVRVIQNKQSNYDTDVFQPLINFIAEKSHVRYGEDEKQDIAMRVISDHIRAISFCIADGTLPSSTKAGYVIRRILRRAVRYGFTFLNLKQPFLFQLIPLLAEQFKGVFPELNSQSDFVSKVVHEEEMSFLRTLATGIQRFERYTPQNQKIDGSFAFELYDTYGFPIDLTELMAREKGLCIDMEAFDNELQQQKDRSRAATQISTGDWIKVNPDEEVEFVGYDELEVQCKILKYRKISSKGIEQVQVVLNPTPFYPEGGGQKGDRGKLEDASRLFEFAILDTKRENGLIIHYLDMLPEELTGSFWAMVNAEERSATESNHSATHLLHAALKSVLGDHVNQKGSLVNSDYLRFDFSHFSKVTNTEIKEIEQLVNTRIRQNIPLKEERNVPYESAIQSGVTALFGEKYGDSVRVITFDDNFSKELCGGTHVKASGQIGYFKIISEGAVAAGVRRIEAISGVKAAEYLDDLHNQLHNIKELLRNPPDLQKSVQGLLEENQHFKREIEKLNASRAAGLKDDLIREIEPVNGLNYLARKIDLASPEAVKNLAYAVRDSVENLFLVLATAVDGKPSLTVILSDSLVKEKGMNAGLIIREIAKEIQGGGGGQPFYATAGGKNADGLEKALLKSRTFIP